MENELNYELAANESLNDPLWRALQQGPYSWLTEEKLKIP